MQQSSKLLANCTTSSAPSSLCLHDEMLFHAWQLDALSCLLASSCQRSHETACPGLQDMCSTAALQLLLQMEGLVQGMCLSFWIRIVSVDSGASMLLWLEPERTIGTLKLHSLTLHQAYMVPGQSDTAWPQAAQGSTGQSRCTGRNDTAACLT